VNQPALLALADGTVFEGTAVGAIGQSVGEVVFNTSITGYQEILSDPSYAEQLVTLTYPHIGNVGANLQDNEARKPWAAGLIIRDYSLVASNWRSEQDLSTYLQQHQIVAISDIDTRALTHILRNKGAQNGCIQAGNIDRDAAIQAAQAHPGLENMDLAKVVTTSEAYEWNAGTWALGRGYEEKSPEQLPYHVVVYDFGVKHNILRILAQRGCRLTVVPAQTSAEACLALKPDGVFLSNGPGDPAACDYAIVTIKSLLEQTIPMFGICLGHQLLALACGATTTKMKFGHHGANHPVQDLATKQVMISSQNHGFTVAEDSLPSSLTVTHRSLFDGTIQGIRHQTKPAYSFQGHPEASPGPHDVASVFDPFIDVLNSAISTKVK